MVRQRDIFELVDVLEGHKVINNRWVFDVKPNGHKPKQPNKPIEVL